MSHPDETPQVRRCNDCRKWYDSSLRECPSCESPRPKFNKSLRTAQLNNHLYGMVANAQKEVALERRLAGRRPGVSSPLDRRPDSFIGRQRPECGELGGEGGGQRKPVRPAAPRGLMARKKKRKKRY